MITARQEAIVSRVEKCVVFADVGCDHGIITSEAFRRNLCKFAVLTDISKPSLEKAVTLLEPYKKFCEFHVTDGLNGVKTKVDFACICGMGGKEIIKIIADSRLEKYLIQPMKNVREIREALILSGYRIVTDEVIASQGKFYDIIKIVKGKDELSEDEKIFGRTNLEFKGEQFIAFVQNNVKKYGEYLKRIDKKSETYEKYNRYIIRAEKILGEKT